MQAPVGHTQARTVLEKAIQGGRASGSWLLHGPQGIGKRALADYTARSYLKDVLPEDRLEAQIKAGSCPNFRVLEPTITAEELKKRQKIIDSGKELDEETEKDRKRNASISVDDIRSIEPFLRLSGGKRVLIVDAADDMNANAGNALLKMLEEPPEQVMMILISHRPAALLPTIRSRCRMVRLFELSGSETKDVLSKNALELIPDAETELLSFLSSGRPGMALLIREKDGPEMFGNLAEIISFFPAFPAEKAYLFCEKAAKDKGKTELAFAFLSMILSKLADSGGHIPKISESAAFAIRSTIPADRIASFASDLRGRYLAQEGVNLDAKQVLLNVLVEFFSLGKRRRS